MSGGFALPRDILDFDCYDADINDKRIQTIRGRHAKVWWALMKNASLVGNLLLILFLMAVRIQKKQGEANCHS